MAIVYKNKEYRNLQEQVLENAKDIEILKNKPSLKVVVVDELPETGEEGYIYLVPKDDGESPDIYDEYVWLIDEERFEFIGTTAINLDEVEKIGFKNPNNANMWRIRADESGNLVTQKSSDNGVNWSNVQWYSPGANAFYVGNIQVHDEVTLGTGMSIKNHDPESSNYIDLMQGGYRRATIGSAAYFYTNVVPGGSQNLGTSTMRWNGIYVGDDGLNLGGTNSVYPTSIKVDSSSRIGLYHNDVERIKIGNENSTYCTANWTPDQDSTYSLGTETMRWSQLNVGRVQNKYSSMFLEANGDVNVKCSNGSGLVPSANNSFTLGKSGQKWNVVYCRYINDDNVAIAPADIATKTNTAWFTGQFDANGELHADMTQLGIPEGMYFITFGGCMTYFYIAPGQVANLTDMGVAGEFNLRAPCPMIFGGSGYPATLRISRQADILTFKVAAPNVGTQDSGYTAYIFKTNLA